MKKFLRRAFGRHSKLGKRRKKKQVWRKPKGRDNKMREKRRGYPPIVKIGYRTKKDFRSKINGSVPVIIRNVKDLENMKKGNIIIIGKVGMKKKIDLVKKAKEKNLEIHRMNSDNFINKFGRSKEKKK